MLRRRLKPVLAAAVVLAFFGCGKQESDNTLGDIAVRQVKQGKEIAKLTTKIGGLERLLAEIRELAENRSPTFGEAGRGGTAVDFRNTSRYQQMAASIQAIQQQLNITQSEVAETKEVLEQQPELMTRGPRPGPLSTRNRQGLSSKLDSMAQKFAETVGDPLRTQKVVAEIEQFKQELLNDPPAKEAYQPLVQDLTQTMESEQSEPALRKWAEKCLKALESASEDNLARRVQEGTDFQNALRLRNLINNNQIPQDVLKDLGMDKLIVTRTNDDGMGMEALGMGLVGEGRRLELDGRTDREYEGALRIGTDGAGLLSE